MIPDLRYRAKSIHEGIDDPKGDVAKMYRTYDDLAQINVLVSGWRRIYTEIIRPHLNPNTATTLLDVGCGGGDITRTLVTWANRDGLRLDTTGIDIDTRAIEYALSLPPLAGTRFYHVGHQELVRTGHQFDLVISNHMLHHLSDLELCYLFDDLRQLARREVILSDLGRSKISYFVFKYVIAPFFRRNTFIRKDGLISIQRAFTGPELRSLLPEGWTYQSQWYDRHIVRYIPNLP